MMDREPETVIPLYLAFDGSRTLVGEVPVQAAQRAGCLVVWRGVRKDRPVRAYATREQFLDLLSWLAGGSGTALGGWRTVYREWLPGAGRYVWSHKPLALLGEELG